MLELGNKNSSNQSNWTTASSIAEEEEEYTAGSPEISRTSFRAKSVALTELGEISQE